MESIWEKSASPALRSALSGDIKTDTLVIGGGIAGILTAYMLTRRNIPCVVVDSGRVADRTTGCTTAKITAQHGLIYAKLRKSFGDDAAHRYLAENLRAVRTYRDIINKENIDCDFENLSSFLFATESMRELEEEHAAITALCGECRLKGETELPFEVSCTLELPHQAQFNPLKFIHSIARGLKIYENTQVLSISGNGAKTQHGTISARRIVLATHFPFINTPGYYFLRMHKQRSYVLALRDAQKICGTYLGLDCGKLSFRNYHGTLLLGGGGHRCGEFSDECGYAPLIKAARRLYPDATEALRWSTEDCMTHDGVPYIGRFSKETENIYVATGFNKWGMTTSLVAADLISRKLAGEDTDFGIFDPQRKNFTPSFRGLLEDAGKSTRGLMKSVFSRPEIALSDIKRGEGKIIEHEGRAYGTYLDTDGTAYIVSAKCTHLGCRLSWNPDDKTWDCPCHGSRFDFRGNIIGNPAQKNLECTVLHTE